MRRWRRLRVAPAEVDHALALPGRGSDDARHERREVLLGEPVEPGGAGSHGGDHTVPPATVTYSSYSGQYGAEASTTRRVLFVAARSASTRPLPKHSS